MKLKYIPVLVIIAMMATMSSCNLYRKYSRPEVNTSGLYRDTLSAKDTLASDTVNIGNLPWQDIFKDPKLQKLIEQGLNSNLDLRNAALRVQEYHALLTSARLAYTPTLSLAPTGTISSFDNSAASKAYQLPAAASWEIDLFGRLLNSKRGAKAALMQSEAYRQAIQTQIVAGIANSYYTLLTLDQQLSISEKTAMSWQQSVETMKALKVAGMVNEAAIAQSEANSYAVSASLPDLRRQIREMENTLSLLLGQPAQAIDRGILAGQELPATLSAGVPAQLLSNRPDVKQAEMILAGAFANTNVARAAFYPQLSISANGGWTNSAGGIITNPAKVLLSATAGLVEPIFNRGANRARLKVAKAQQEEARLSFQKSILNAGNEVSNALYQYKTAEDKSQLRQNQILSLEHSVDYTQQLLRLGSSTYLEVLTAQQALLNAQLTDASDQFQRIQAMVNLYQALGGGR